MLISADHLALEEIMAGEGRETAWRLGREQGYNLKHEKGPFFGRSFPVKDIIGSTPRGAELLLVTSNSYFGNCMCDRVMSTLRLATSYPRKLPSSFLCKQHLFVFRQTDVA